MTIDATKTEYTRREACEILDVTQTTVNYYLYNDKVPMPRKGRGGRLIFTREDILNLAQAIGVEPEHGAMAAWWADEGGAQ